MKKAKIGRSVIEKVVEVVFRQIEGQRKASHHDAAKLVECAEVGCGDPAKVGQIFWPLVNRPVF